MLKGGTATILLKEAPSIGQRFDTLSGEGFGAGARHKAAVQLDTATGAAWMPNGQLLSSGSRDMESIQRPLPTNVAEFPACARVCSGGFVSGGDT